MTPRQQRPRQDRPATQNTANRNTANRTTPATQRPAADTPANAVARSPQLDRTRQQPARSGSTDEFQRLMQANTVHVAHAARRRRRSPAVGKLALVLAIVAVALDASAFAVLMGNEMSFASGVAMVVVFLTLVAALLGFVAAVAGLGRWYGVIAVVVSFVANPVVLGVLVVLVAPEVATDLPS